MISTPTASDPLDDVEKALRECIAQLKHIESKPQPWSDEDIRRVVTKLMVVSASSVFLASELRKLRSRLPDRTS